MKKNWVSKPPGLFDRLEGAFQGTAYAPHRHDTYAIGVTLQGVQTFDYRGATRHSLPGQMVVLHPDELHDGRAGTEDGFRYKILYVDPSTLQDVLNGQPLPFIKDGISNDIRLSKVLVPLLNNHNVALEHLEYQDAIYDLATVLNVISGNSNSNRKLNYQATKRAKAFIDDSLDEGICLDELEHVTGYDRWQLSRDFRSLYGTSPNRYLIHRRLERARELLINNVPISSIAIDCGFADQSHLGRHFKKTYGLSPKAWTLAYQSQFGV